MKTVLILLAATLVAPLAHAIPITSDGCGGDGGPALGILDTGYGYYVDGRSNGIWVWEESNGLPGLQTVNGATGAVGDAYTCGPSDTTEPADTLVV